MANKKDEKKAFGGTGTTSSYRAPRPAGSGFLGVGVTDPDARRSPNAGFLGVGVTGLPSNPLPRDRNAFLGTGVTSPRPAIDQAYKGRPIIPGFDPLGWIKNGVDKVNSTITNAVDNISKTSKPAAVVGKAIQEVVRPSYESLAGNWSPDVARRKAVAAAKAGIQNDLSQLEQTRQARLAEIRSRYDLTGPNSAEKENLDREVAAINGDAQKAMADTIRSYGAATNEATAKASVAEGIAARSSGDIKKFYDAASTAVNASNAGALAAVGGGLGNTVIGGEATLAPEAIAIDGLRESASAADDAAVRRDDMAFLRDSIGNESANSQRDVTRAEQDSLSTFRNLWNTAVQERIAAERNAMNNAVDSTNTNFDGRAWGLQDQGRGFDIDLANQEAQSREAYNSDRTGYNVAGAMSDYERSMMLDDERRAKREAEAERNAAEMRAMASARMVGRTPTAGMPNALKTAQELTGNAIYEDSGEAFNPTQASSVIDSELQAIALMGGTYADKVQAVNALIGSLPPSQVDYLQLTPQKLLQRLGY